MNESDLAKDYELTTFCEAAAAAYDPTEKGFARLRNKEGKKGSPLSAGDNADEYKYALLVEKMVNVTPQNGTYQQKIYNYFKTGIKGHSISETDLDWFIKYMTDYTMAKEIKSFTKAPKEMQRGETHNLNVVLSPANASGKVKYTSSNEAVAKVSEDGVITAVKGGSAKITMEVDGLVKSTTVKVATIESTTPVSTYYNEGRYFLKTSNSVKNGSFEYGSSYLNWKTGKGTAMSETCFALKHYDNSEYTYIESKLDGDEKSEGSIRMEWGVVTNKVYVFGYQVRNTTSQKNERNENLKAMNIKYGEADESKGKLFEYPTYDGNWTDIQYVFFAEPDYDACRIVFSHLSNDSNNTCFDNFYLCELDTITGVRNIILPTTNKQVYDLNDHIRIIDGKKYLIK